jgi:hypothetical protein
MSRSLTKPRGRPVVHGIKPWLRYGKISLSIRGHKKLQGFLENFEKQLIEEQGGMANLSAAKELLIRATIRAYGVILLSELYISKYSVIRPDMARKGVLQYQPILERSYWGAQAQIRQNLALLGLERKVPNGELTLAQVIKEFDEEKARKADRGMESGEAEKVDPGASGEEISGREET